MNRLASEGGTGRSGVIGVGNIKYEFFVPSPGGTTRNVALLRSFRSEVATL
jgi:hypothetical protein